MFLDRKQIFDLTGYKQRGKQIQWLRENGFKFAVGADGYPRVLISAIEGVMGRDSRRTKPDAKALHDFLAERS